MTGKIKLLHDFRFYQVEARKTAIYPSLGNNLWYPALGLAGEAGEVAEKIKKIYRDGEGKVTIEKRVEIGKELGDVLWYVASIASELKLDLAGIAETNLIKLQSRAQRGKVHGSGDER